MVEQVLQRHGFKGSAFTDPRMVLEYLNVNRKDCSMVLSDIRMPGMNDYKFLKQVKNINPQVKVIFMPAFDLMTRNFTMFYHLLR